MLYIKRSLLVLLSLFFGASAYAQEGLPVYMDYFADNLYLLHPSMAGASSVDKIRLTARAQWFDNSRSPSLQTLSYNGRVGERSGIGVIVFNDKNGYHSQLGGYLTYAHHIELNSSAFRQLSFGVSAGGVDSRLDERYFDPSIYDPIIAGIMQSTSYFNADIGFSYNSDHLSLHATVKNLLYQNRDLYTKDFESNNLRRYILGAGYVIPLANDDWVLEPSVLFQLVDKTEEKHVDANFKAYKEMDFGRLWFGLSYRQSFDGAKYLKDNSVKTQKLNYITPVLGLDIGNFMAAYTYSYQTGSIVFDNGGYHQITIGYNFGDGWGRGSRLRCLNPSVR